MKQELNQLDWKFSIDTETSQTQNRSFAKVFTTINRNFPEINKVLRLIDRKTRDKYVFDVMYCVVCLFQLGLTKLVKTIREI